MADSNVRITANIASSLSYITRQCEIYLCNKYHKFNDVNSFSFLRSIRIFNDTNSDIVDCILKVTFNTPEIDDTFINISCLDKGKIIEISNNINIKINPEKLYELNESKIINVNFVLTTKDNEVISNKCYPLTILPIEQLSSGISGDNFVPEMLSSYVTPNDDYVIDVFRKATKILQEENRSSFIGYEANDPNYVLKELDALYKALRNEGIAYALPPASFEKVYQRVRLPQKVLTLKQGTCLDTTLLFASLIECAGLHPLIFLTNKHAFVGCWLEEDSQSGTNEDNSALFTEASEKGISKLVCIETTLICSGQTASLNDAIEVGRNNLIKNIFKTAIDINSCRKTGIYKPIPTMKKDGVTDIHFDVLDLLNEDLMKVDTSLRDKYIQNQKSTDKFDLWERKLLDLNLSNKLINFKTRKNSLRVLINNPQELLESITNKDRFNLEGYSSKEKGIDTDILSYQDKNYIDSAIKNGKIIIETDALKFDDEIKKVARRSNSAFEESGSNILFLAIGIIEWFPTLSSVYPNYAPLLLIPAQISSRKVGKYYTADFFLEEARLNITFLEYVKQNYNLNINLNGRDLSIDKNGIIGFDEICNTLTNELNIKNWKIIKDKAFIDTFSFSHFVMWEDIYNRKQLLLKNAVVSSLYYGTSEKVNKEKLVDINIDKNIKPIDLAAPLSADSSQIEAILSCAKGDSFILFGPPGTGKSQTIANMIVNLMYQGKSVLFVAEKMVALEVVKHRLDEIGLGNFCCQIHSNKISKSEVLRQIENAIEMQTIQEPKDVALKAEKLLEKRNLLNKRLEEIHSNTNYFISLYDAILKYEDLKSKGVNDYIEIKDDYLRSLNVDTFNKSIEDLKNVELAAIESGGYFENPFNFYRGDTYNLEIREELKNKLIELNSKIKELIVFNKAFAKKYGFLEINDLKTLHDFFKVLDLLKEEDCFNFNSLLDFDYEENAEVSNVYLDSKINELSLKEDINRRFNKNIFNIDEKEMLNELSIANKSNFIKRFILKNKFIKQLSLYSLSSEEKIKRKELENILITIKKYKEANDLNKNIDKVIYYHFDNFDHETSSDYKDIKILFNNTKELYVLLKNSSFYNKENIESFKKLFNDKEKLFSKELDNFKKQNIDFSNYLNDFYDNQKIDFVTKEISFERMDEQTHEAIINIGKFNLWILFNRSMEIANSDGLCFMIDKLKNNTIKLNEIATKYMFSIYFKLIMSYFKLYDFNEFTKPTLEKHIEEYKELINDYNRLTIENVAAKITKNSPIIDSKYITSTEPAMIKKLIKSNGKGTTLRNIMSNLGDFIKKICPCFLMSPLSIAQYIDPDKMHFDVVIFDEASQIPTSEAVGAIARGNSVVIAGDYNQMPPTNFFKTQIDSDVSFFDNETDLDSLLDDCISVGLPQKKLLWHYRSHHESLIAFSNNKFYKNNLFTFPSPSNLISNVKFINVHGIYERNKGVNEKEANEIVKEIIRRIKDPILSKKSIGVVTFNQKQQNLIQDLLDNEYDKNPNLNFKPGNETIFVKNLENVQGDERDVILFSICFAKRKDGELSLNFGPLSLEKGERRLNVAVSRSRDEMIIYSSIEPMDINANNAKNEGARYLKDLLEYAKYGTKTLTKNVDNNDLKFDKSVAEFIAKDLEKLGYKCDLDVGTSNFRVDIAIKNEKGDSYCLGIICDSSFYYDAKTCRDRNILHYDILNRLGWNIARIWTLDYYDHPKEVIKSIVEKVSLINKGLVNNHLDDDRNESKPIISFKRKSEDSWMVNKISYVKYNEFIARLNDDREVLMVLKGLINKEAPVTFDYIKERIRKMSNISRISKKESDRLRYLIGECGFYHTLSPDTYWINTDQYLSFKNYRENKDIDICKVPYEELGNLFTDIIKDLKTIDKKDLFKFVTVFYGYKVMSQKTQNYLEDCLHYLVMKKYNSLMQSGDLIKIKE